MVIRDPFTGRSSGQRHSGQTRGSAGGVDDQSVPAAAESDRRQQLPGRDSRRRTRRTSSSRASTMSLDEKQKIFGHYLYQGAGQSHDPNQPGLSGAATVQQPKHGSSARHDVEFLDPERGPLRVHARRPQSAQPAPDDGILRRRGPGYPRHARRRSQWPSAKRERDRISDDQHSGLQRVRRQRRWRRNRY